MAMNDLVIRGATVFDGLGNEPVRADVAVRDGRVAAVGKSAPMQLRSSTPAGSR